MINVENVYLKLQTVLGDCSPYSKKMGHNIVLLTDWMVDQRKPKKKEGETHGQIISEQNSSCNHPKPTFLSSNFKPARLIYSFRRYLRQQISTHLGGAYMLSPLFLRRTLGLPKESLRKHGLLFPTKVLVRCAARFRGCLPYRPIRRHVGWLLVSP